jgi:hypothetical protein
LIFLRRASFSVKNFLYVLAEEWFALFHELFHRREGPIVHLLLESISVRVFVDAVVDEAELPFIRLKLKIIFEVLGVFSDCALFRDLFAILAVTDTLRVVCKLSKDHHRVFEEVQSKHLAENFDGVLQLLTQARLLRVEDYQKSVYIAYQL